MAHGDVALAGGDTFFEFCTTSTGGTNLNLKGSGGVGGENTFLVKASTAKTGGVILHDIVFSLLDAGMEWGKFGGEAALTDGCQVRIMSSTVGSSGVIKDFTATQTIKTNEDFTLLGSVTRLREPAAGDDLVSMVWHIHDTFGHGIHLRQGDEFQVRVRDATSKLSSFQVVAHGYYPGS